MLCRSPSPWSVLLLLCLLSLCASGSSTRRVLSNHFEHRRPQKSKDGIHGWFGQEQSHDDNVVAAARSLGEGSTQKNRCGVTHDHPCRPSYYRLNSTMLACGVSVVISVVSLYAFWRRCQQGGGPFRFLLLRKRPHITINKRRRAIEQMRPFHVMLTPIAEETIDQIQMISGDDDDGWAGTTNQSRSFDRSHINRHSHHYPPYQPPIPPQDQGMDDLSRVAQMTEEKDNHHHDGPGSVTIPKPSSVCVLDPNSTSSQQPNHHHVIGTQQGCIEGRDIGIIGGIENNHAAAAVVL